jgi:hypothetical protein
MSEMLTAADAAQRLGITQGQVMWAVQSGWLACYRIAGDVRFDLADLLEYDAARLKLRSPRILREAERLRMLIPAEHRPTSSLTAAEQGLAAKRYRRLRRAPWADATAIRAIYASAKRLTQETGVPHHVDHIIPLQGALVSGLHVHTNLQVLPAVDNIKKLNRYEVEA